MRVRPLNVDKRSYGGVLEPGELFKREKELFVSDEQPESMPGYVCDLSFRNVFTRRCGFHRHAVPVDCSLTSVLTDACHFCARPS